MPVQNKKSLLFVMHLHCSGYFRSRALWRANIYRVSQIHLHVYIPKTKLVVNCINKNAITTSNNLLSYNMRITTCISANPPH